MKIVFPDQTDKISEAEIGAKAAGLWRHRDLAVPGWFAVTRGAFLGALTPEQSAAFAAGMGVSDLVLPDDLQDEVLGAAVRLGEDDHLLAVRSSAIGEDGANASFAGQLQSFLNIAPQEVPAYVLQVWQSALSESVAAYAATQGRKEPLVPAVLVQRMVQPRVAGVAFGCDPVTGDTSVCVINAIAGLADRLVGGEETGVLYRVEADGRVLGVDPLLSHDEARGVQALVRQVEARAAGPQDIEWAIGPDGLVLLQARPVTTLNRRLGDTIVWDNSNIVESYSGVTSPLTFSFARYVYAHVYIEFCRLMGVSKAKIKAHDHQFWHMLGHINGHVYYNLVNWYRLLALFPGFRLNRGFMEQMMGVKTPLPEEMVAEIVGAPASGSQRWLDGARLARTGLSLIWHQLKLPATIRTFYTRLNEALAMDDLASRDIAGLVRAYRDLETRLLSAWDAPLINDFLCMIAFGASRKLMERWGAENGLELHADVMIGQGDIISAEPARRMREMAELIRGDEAAIESFVRADPAAITRVLRRTPLLEDRLVDYLETFSDRCLQELKLESPTLADDPSTLLRAIGHLAKADRPKAEDRPQPDLSKVVGGPVKAMLASWSLTLARAGVRRRENLRFERTRVFGRVRRIFVEIGKRLTEAGVIDTPSDIFMLEVSEVLGYAEGTSTLSDLRGLIALRRAEQARQMSSSAPPPRFLTHGAVGLSVRSGLRPDVTAASMDVTSIRGESLKGLGCCRGVVRGRVRVITDPRGARLEPGEIMVAQFTDPGWITLFVNAAGILVERGSLLSHSAIVAREMNIPAIVGLDGVTVWLKTGDEIVMDGATGLVVRAVES